jgi:putative endonuclease
MIGDKQYFVYIIASDSGTIYIGVTNNLIRRITEHKERKIKGFSQKYNCHKLIYYEDYGLISAALYREKELKKWNRLKKQILIKSLNPTWKDLFDSLV